MVLFFMFTDKDEQQHVHHRRHRQWDRASPPVYVIQ